MPEKQESPLVINTTSENQVTIGLVTQLSTTANASFDQYVSIFTKRISDKADELFRQPEDHAASQEE